MNISEILNSRIDKSDWIQYKFSDFAENIVEKIVPRESGLEHYIGLEHLDAGSIKINRFGDPQSLKGDKLKIYKGDIIFAKRNAYLKRASLAEFDGVASAHSMVLRAIPGIILPEFFPFFMQSDSFWDVAIRISVGGLSPTINWKQMAKQEFLLPPKDQQAKIAELLWAMDDVVEKEKEVLEKMLKTDLTQLKYYFYDDVISNRIQLKNIITMKKGKKPNTLLENKDGIPYCTAKYLRTGEIEYTVKTNLSENIVKIDNSDILVLWDGSNAGEILLGKDGILASTMVQLNFVDNEYLPKFIYHFLRFKSNDIRRATVGSAIPHVDSGIINNIKIPMLTKSEQIEIVNKFGQLRKGKNCAKATIYSSQQLQKSLINEIFTV